MEGAHHLGPDSHSHALLAVVKASTVIVSPHLAKTWNGEKRQRGAEKETRAVCLIDVQTENGRARSATFPFSLPLSFFSFITRLFFSFFFSVVRGSYCALFFGQSLS